MTNSLRKLAKSLRGRSYPQRNLPTCLELFDIARPLSSPLPVCAARCHEDFRYVQVHVRTVVSEVVIDVLGLLPKHQFEMITKFITEVSTTFNPFLPRAKTARLFLSFLPPNARQTMKVDTKLLPRASRDPSFIQLKFSKLDLRGSVDHF